MPSSRGCSSPLRPGFTGPPLASPPMADPLTPNAPSAETEQKPSAPLVPLTPTASPTTPTTVAPIPAQQRVPPTTRPRLIVRNALLTDVDAIAELTRRVYGEEQ